jgi:hypothetical protein
VLAASAAVLLSSLHNALCHFQCSTWQALQQYLAAAAQADSGTSLLKQQQQEGKRLQKH